MLKKLFVLLMLILLVISYGCQSKNEKITIGLIISATDNPFFISLRDSAVEEANYNDYKIIVMDSENLFSKELENMQELIDKNVDIIIINPTDSDSVFKCIKLANDKNIPVITVDRNSNGGRILSHITSNNVTGGKLAAQFILEEINYSGKVAELKGISGTSAAKERSEGFFREIKSFNEIALISEVADFNRETAKNVMSKMLGVHPDIKAVFAHNDEMALGALQAIKLSELDIIVVGFDGTDEAIQSINNEELNMTIAQQPEIMGRTCIETVKSYINEDEIEPIIYIELRTIVNNK